MWPIPAPPVNHHHTHRRKYGERKRNQALVIRLPSPWLIPTRIGGGGLEEHEQLAADTFSRPPAGHSHSGRPRRQRQLAPAHGSTHVRTCARRCTHYVGAGFNRLSFLRVTLAEVRRWEAAGIGVCFQNVSRNLSESQIIRNK